MYQSSARSRFSTGHLLPVDKDQLHAYRFLDLQAERQPFSLARATGWCLYTKAQVSGQLRAALAGGVIAGWRRYVRAWDGPVVGGCRSPSPPRTHVRTVRVLIQLTRLTF